MKLDKEQQKHFAEAIRNASKKKGFKVKGCSIYDDIFWKVLQMAESMSEAEKNSTYLNVKLAHKGD